MKLENCGRLDWLDYMRALAMVAVYLLHVLDRLNESQPGATSVVWQVASAVAVPAFFFISGMLARRERRPLQIALAAKLRRNLYPIAFFSVMMLPFWLLYGKTMIELQAAAKMYLYGSPRLHWMMWYMIAALWIELFAWALFAWFGDRPWISWLWCLLFAFAGGVLTPLIIDLQLRHGLPRELWFMGESLVCATFYFAGHATRPLLTQLPRKFWLACMLLLTTVLACVAAANNQVPVFRAVTIPFSIHGNYLLFLATAFTGILAITLLAQLLPANVRPMLFVGRNTLVYFGLNGLCLHFIDRMVASEINLLPDTLFVKLPLALAYVTLMLTLFAPLTTRIRRQCAPLLGLD